MLNLLLIAFGKSLSKFSQIFNLGNGSTWPGHIALSVNKHFSKQLLIKSQIKIILIAGTNGKTTTARLIRTVLEKNGKKVFQNESGANLLNGLASTLLLNSDSKGGLSQDYAIFEVDENVLPLILREITPDYLILLNLFRDQLDRYGEIRTIAGKWKKAITSLSEKTTLIVNADDSQVAYLGNEKKLRTLYFGLDYAHSEQNNLQHAADSVYCPKCGGKLSFHSVSFSHLGDWSCPDCKYKRPRPDLQKFPVYPLSGTYNKFNTLAAVLLLKQAGIQDRDIEESFKDFKPAFGRQEIIEYNGKKVQLFLSKNPTSFNQSYAAIRNLEARTLIILLNDRIPDGRDVSWIWDIDLPGLTGFKHILVTGDRVYDMALRMKYENSRNYRTFEDVAEAIKTGIELTEKDETLFILPTYSAMLEVRKILTGKKIL